MQEKKKKNYIYKYIYIYKEIQNKKANKKKMKKRKKMWCGKSRVLLISFDTRTMLRTF